MAHVTAKLRLKVSDGFLVESYKPQNIESDLLSNLGSGGVQHIDDSSVGEYLDIDDGQEDGGFLYARNLDKSTTNWVELGSYSHGTFYAFAILKGGEFFFARVTTKNIRVRTNPSGNDVDLEWRMFNP